MLFLLNVAIICPWQAPCSEGKTFIIYGIFLNAYFFPQGYIPNFKHLTVKSTRLRKVYPEEFSCHFTVFGVFSYAHVFT